ncbi:MAG: zinc ABC transporter substrate-binding protein [Desulfobacula sp.]|nr:zinc ABC transporter substrate-binding protein [Desulfobacula sp.]
MIQRTTQWLIKPIVAGLVIFVITSAFAGEKLPVFVSIIPQKYFVQQIGKDLVDVQVMVQPGASPAIYEPKPRQMAALSKAKLYFSIGVPFEATWLKKITAANPQLVVIHTDHDIKKIPMNSHHDNGDEDHGKKGLDPHIWLSPNLVKIQAASILNALKKTDPLHTTQYETNHALLIKKITDLNHKLQQIFKGKNQHRFMVFHPSWGYFANTYNLIQIPIEIEGRSPKPAQLKDLIKKARKNKVRVIFVQPQFSSKNARVIAKEIKGRIIFADPLAADWMDNMQKVAEKFEEALR